MRLFILITIVSIAPLAHAHSGELIEAVKRNDVNEVSHLLDFAKFDVNQHDEHGYRPIFFVSSPEMLLVLLERGATLRAHRTTIYTDNFGRNPLHYLLGVTAPYLFARARNETHKSRLRKRIQNTALLMMQHNVIDDVSDSQLRGRIERLEDNSGLTPADYLVEADGWDELFQNRIYFQHYVEHRAVREATPESEEEQESSDGEMDVGMTELHRIMERELAEFEVPQDDPATLGAGKPAHILNLELAAENFFRK